MKTEHKKKIKKPVIREKVVQFQRDSDYYFNKGNLYLQKNDLEKAMLYLRKAVEMDPKDGSKYYNLGCLHSRRGELEEANRVFRHVLEKVDPDCTECYFARAINYGLLEEMEMARTSLYFYLMFSPDGEMADEAAEIFLSLVEDEGEMPSPAGLEMAEIEDDWVDMADFCTPEDLYISILNTATEQEIKRLYKIDEEFQDVLISGLYHWDDETKEKIISIYALLGDKKGENALRRFVKNPWVKERLRQLALLSLKEMGFVNIVEVFQDGKFQRVGEEDLVRETPLWKPEWQSVLDCAWQKMQDSGAYNEDFLADIHDIWLDYINTVFPNIPRISKVETWAAGLEYSLVRFHFLNVSQQEIAGKYGVSASSVAAKFKKINKVLDLEQKTFQK